ncbi:pyochelin biosynthetic protein PchC [Catenulispora sp. GP43]|uniref:thioesterase II family protein n=1 Tax=Catenulispora sp. GP43 TaxID=3156263 RepID=UPI0035125CBB
MNLPRCLWDVDRAGTGPFHTTLVLLPHSGGSAQAFGRWRGSFPAGVRVLAAQYPGRASRTSEPHAGTVRDIAAELAAALEPESGRLGVFGHSLGAYVGFELCRELERAGRPPAVFFPSAAVPAHHDRGWGSSPADLTDGELLGELREYGGTPDGLEEFPDMLSLALGVCRADLTLAYEYSPGPGPWALSAPIVALGGDADTVVSPAGLRGWGDLGTGPFEVHTFPGNHFYHLEHTAAVTRILAEALSRTTAR